MADLGNLLGSLMCGLIRARRMADEQTAALAEYYKDNPLLEGLSVPRIRIPELTIDMPLLIEDQVEGDSGRLADTTKIVSAVKEQLEFTLSKNNIEMDPAFRTAFVDEIRTRLVAVRRSGTPVMKETVTRGVQDAFADVLISTRSTLSTTDKEIIARDLRSKVSSVSVAKEPVASSINANIRTADVKEKASDASVVRLTITLKEEGLEWATQAGESGGIVRTLQPE